ncbi:unnamed protein product [Nippostrongylus brasiliensis]|uniref:non-specific protein-tyrosine kinase n=1 Tax=Nippostrongylus brasiliensis TaxID=27835 RepID=A0A0N4YF87_NIPBR|nr:unnamed protein product [Nippostrongylus brasiliensis]
MATKVASAVPAESKEEYRVRDKIHIIKIRDSLAGGLHSVKNEEYFHGFLPKEQTYDLLVKVGDFLVRQAVRLEQKTFAAEDKRKRDIAELRHIPIKYSRRAKLYYVRLYGFKLVSGNHLIAYNSSYLLLEEHTPHLGLIEYHRRNKIPFDEEGTIIKRAIKRAEWQLNHEQIVKTKKLGDGAFGDVYKGVLYSGLIDSKEVAIKTIIGSVSTEENEKLFRVRNNFKVFKTNHHRSLKQPEAMLMKRLVHPNVVMLIGVASNEEPVMIVMEFAQGGSVLDAVQSKPGPSVYTRIKYCNHAAQGLHYLTKQGIIHRDVAARNCLIGKHDTGKISDFGLSIVGTQKKEKTLKKVPVRYLAPETLKKREYTIKTDVWSFGVFMWEVFHDGKEPYGDMTAKEVRKYVLSGNILDNESDHYPQHMWTITVVGGHIIDKNEYREKNRKSYKSCFARDPATRPFFDVIADEILNGIEDYREEKPFMEKLKFW